MHHKIDEHDVLTALTCEAWEEEMSRHNAVLRGGAYDGTTLAMLYEAKLLKGPAEGTVSVYEPTDSFEDHDGHDLRVYQFTGERSQP